MLGAFKYHHESGSVFVVALSVCVVWDKAECARKQVSNLRQYNNIIYIDQVYMSRERSGLSGLWYSKIKVRVVQSISLSYVNNISIIDVYMSSKFHKDIANCYSDINIQISSLLSITDLYP